MRLLREWPQHVIGVAGQVAAGLPQIVVTIYLARRSSLEAAGLYTVATGLAAAAFTAALWGFAPHIVLDRLRRFPAMTYLVARSLALVLVSLGILAASRAYFPEIGVVLVLAVIAFRGADAVIDLQFGLTQVWRGAGPAIYVHAALHACKLLLLVVLLILPGRLTRLAPEHVILISAILALAGSVAILAAQPRLRRAADHAPNLVARLFGQTAWLALAAIFCAIVTNVPRISLPHFHEGDALGVAGIALTISTFFGMAFYTAWIRHFSGLTVNPRADAVAAFAFEIAVLGALFASAAVWLLPALVAGIFDFDLMRHGHAFQSILLAAVAFFAGMSLANLYKLGRHQWIESLVYLMALGLMIGWRFMHSEQAGLPTLLVLGGASMTALSIPALFMRRRSSEVGSCND